MSAQAQLSKASYFKKNSTTLMQTGIRTAHFSLFPVGSISLFSDNIRFKTSNILSVWGYFLPILLLSTCYIWRIAPFFFFIFMFSQLIVRSLRSRVTSCTPLFLTALFVMVPSQEIVVEWMNEWKNDKNWRAGIDESLGRLVKRITKLKSG